MKMGAKVRGVGLHILTWDRAFFSAISSHFLINSIGNLHNTGPGYDGLTMFLLALGFFPVGQLAVRTVRRKKRKKNNLT